MDDGRLSSIIFFLNKKPVNLLLLLQASPINPRLLMTEPKRLFDFLDLALERFSKPDMLAAKEKGAWRTYSTQEVRDTVNRLSAGLLQLGVSGGDRSPEGVDKISILSNNRPEWVFLDYATQQTGAVLAPIYPTTNPSEIKFIFNDAQVKYVFVSSAELYEKVRAVLPETPSVKGIFTFEEVPGARHWTEVLNLANETSLAEVERIKSGIGNKDIATIIYTSGTTGTPKGVMLSHNNILSCTLLSKKSFPFDDAPEARALSFLPLNHIFERLITNIYVASGIGIYYAESLETIGDNLKEVKPHVFTTVPRLLEKVYDKIIAKGATLTGVKRKLFDWAVKLGLKYDNNKPMGFLYDIQLALANKLIFKKWREALGGNVRYIVTGGAACQVRLLRIFNAGKIPVFEGYGPTENSPVITVNRRTPGGNRFGGVGPPLDGIEVKLEADGEVCVKGPTVMMGYYKRQDLTDEVIINGWLHTGDIGVFDEAGALKITDRKKELFKTSGGKYVAPQPIENKMKESLYIAQVMVVGADRKFVGALIVPNFDNIREWAKEQAVTVGSNEEMIRNPQVLSLIKGDVERFNELFNHVEQVKKFELLPYEWTVEGGELTPKLSMKRKVIMEKYRDAIERIYAE
jgi:long-chain acyl-CoA synthetase